MDDQTPEELILPDDYQTRYDTPEGHKSGFVTIVGRPNAGKSTLLNGFMQQKIAIVTPRPQTTRTNQLGIISEEHYQMVFIDTPGLISDPRHKLDEFMRDSALDTLTDADVIVWMVDVSQRPLAEAKQIASQLTAIAEHKTVILGLNKLDLLKAEQVMPHTTEWRSLLPEDTAWIAFSALQGNGRSELFQMIIDALPEGPRYYPLDQITDVYVRDIAGELIREQIMLQLREEIPYSTAVKILDFKERDNGTTYVSANIYVERDTHKRIIIGKKGSQLRRIGAGARKEIEDLIQGKVFLELWVKVEPKWRTQERSLKQLGYSKDE